ncbi:MAG: hypothetical protein JXX14_05200, partial [Deltaproteobacteria bacterium]|nr:hypothetical protein [Deltaproteobacteria bacterium]
MAAEQHISWYALERLALGQLSAQRSEGLEEALQHSEFWRARQMVIASDTRPLPVFAPEKWPVRPVWVFRHPVWATCCTLMILGVSILMWRGGFA